MYCRFGITALDAFHNHLSSGHYRPDIKRIRHLVRKAQKRRALFEERKRSYELANQLLKSRESLLSNAYRQGFNQPVNRTMSKFHWRKSKPIIGQYLFYIFRPLIFLLYFGHFDLRDNTNMRINNS